MEEIAICEPTLKNYFEIPYKILFYLEFKIILRSLEKTQRDTINAQLTKNRQA